jgi:hypothetical protein
MPPTKTIPPLYTRQYDLPTWMQWQPQARSSPGLDYSVLLARHTLLQRDFRSGNHPPFHKLSTDATRNCSGNCHMLMLDSFRLVLLVPAGPAEPPQTRVPLLNLFVF